MSGPLATASISVPEPWLRAVMPLVHNCIESNLLLSQSYGHWAAGNHRKREKLEQRTLTLLEGYEQLCAALGLAPVLICG